MVSLRIKKQSFFIDKDQDSAYMMLLHTFKKLKIRLMVRILPVPIRKNDLLALCKAYF
jgi:hypothetical protein